MSDGTSKQVTFREQQSAAAEKAAEKNVAFKSEFYSVRSGLISE